MSEEVIDLGDGDSSSSIEEMNDTNTTAHANEIIRFVQLSLDDVREEIDEEPTKQEEFSPLFTYVFFLYSLSFINVSSFIIINSSLELLILLLFFDKKKRPNQR